MKKILTKIFKNESGTATVPVTILPILLVTIIVTIIGIVKYFCA